MTRGQEAAPTVTVALHGYFSRTYSGRGRQTAALPLDIASTPRSVLSHLALPPGAVGLVLINGNQASLDEPLHAGDRLDVLPLLGGG